MSVSEGAIFQGKIAHSDPTFCKKGLFFDFLLRDFRHGRRKKAIKLQEVKLLVRQDVGER